MSLFEQADVFFAQFLDAGDVEVRYAGKTPDELQALAITDPLARAYIGANASSLFDQIYEDASEARWQEAIEEAEGQFQAGVDQTLERLRREYLTALRISNRTLENTAGVDVDRELTKLKKLARVLVAGVLPPVCRQNEDDPKPPEEEKRNE